MSSGSPDGFGRRVYQRVSRGVVRGAAGGLLATVLVTLYRFPIFRALPPTAEFWAKYVGEGDAEAHPAAGLLLHFLYGGVAGSLLGVVVDVLDLRVRSDRGFLVIGLSLAYSIALSVFGTQFVFRLLLDEELEPSEAVIFHVAHVIYGLTLGTWLSFDERLGEVYE